MKPKQLLITRVLFGLALALHVLLPSQTSAQSCGIQVFLESKQGTTNRIRAGHVGFYLTNSHTEKDYSVYANYKLITHYTLLGDACSAPPQTVLDGSYDLHFTNLMTWSFNYPASNVVSGNSIHECGFVRPDVERRDGFAHYTYNSNSCTKVTVNGVAGTNACPGAGWTYLSSYDSTNGTTVTIDADTTHSTIFTLVNTNTVACYNKEVTDYSGEFLSDEVTVSDLVGFLTNNAMSQLAAAKWGCPVSSYYSLSEHGMCGSIQAAKWRLKYFAGINVEADIVVKTTYSGVLRSAGPTADGPADWPAVYRTYHITGSGGAGTLELDIEPFRAGGNIRSSTINVEIVGVSSSCGGAGFGGRSESLTDDGLLFTFGLGACSSGNGPGFLYISGQQPAPAMATVAGLGQFINLCAAEVIGEPLQQIKVPEGLVTVAEGGGGLTLSYYTSVGTKDSMSGLYSFDAGSLAGSQTITYSSGGSGATAFKKLQATPLSGPYAAFVYSNGWLYLDHGDGVWGEQTMLVVNGNGVVTTNVTQTRNEAGTTVLSQDVTAYAVNPVTGQRQRVSQISGVGVEALTNYWTYAFNLATNDINYGKETGSISGTGRWDRKVWGTNGLLQSLTEGFGNLGTNATSSQVRLFEFYYTPFHSSDAGTVSREIPRITYEYLQNTLISMRGVALWPDNRLDIVFHTANFGHPEDWNSSLNLKTLTTQMTYLNGSGSGTLSPGGVLNLSATLTNASGTYSTNITIANAPNTEWNWALIRQGTKTITVSSVADGHVLSSTSYDCATNIVTDRRSYSYFGTGNHSYTITFLDGSTETHNRTDCCGETSSIERSGVTNEFVYDVRKRLVVTKRLGIVNSNYFDNAGRSLGAWRFGTDGSAIQTSTATYDTLGRVKIRSNAMGHSTTNFYSLAANGQFVVETVNPDGSSQKQYHNKDGMTERSVGSAVFPQRYTNWAASNYSYSRQIALETNETDTSEYVTTKMDFAGRSVANIYADGATATNLYDGDNHVLVAADPDGVATLYVYNIVGQPEYTILDVNGDRQTNFAGSDRITRSVQAVVNNGNGRGDVRSSVSYTWNEEGDGNSIETSRFDQSTDGLSGWTTIFGYTTTNLTVLLANGLRVTTVKAPDGSSSVMTNQYGRLVSMTQRDASGAQTGQQTYSYDAHGRLRFVTDARNGTTTNTYDNLDRVVSTATPAPASGQSSQVTSTLFDNAGRAWKNILPDGTAVTNQFQATGALTKRTGSRTYPVQQGYDSRGRMTSLRTWKDYIGNDYADTAWGYNSRGQLSSKTYADSTSLAYGYTAAGRLAQRTWARSIVTTTTYAAGDLTGVAYNDGTAGEARTLTRRGQTATATRAGVTTNRFTYHDAGPMTSEAQNSAVVTNRYDPLLRRTNVAVVVGGTVVSSAGYGYDSAGRLATVTDGTNSATYSYVANSRLIDQIVFKQSATTRMTTTKRHDLLNRLTAMTNLPSAEAALLFNYAYNTANQRTAITNADSSRWTYNYDALGQVTSGKKYWSDGTLVLGQQNEYTFDDIGNRKTAVSGGDASDTHKRTQNYTANNVNQYTQRTVPGWLDVIGTATNSATVTVNAGTSARKSDYYRTEVSVLNSGAAVWLPITNTAVLASGTNDYVTNWTGNVFVPQTPEKFTFDLDGNQTSDGRWTNKWDSENRLLSMTSHANAPVASRLSLIFAYDAQSRRISKVVSNWTGSAWAKLGEQRFVYDGWNLIAILDENNAVQVSFAWGTDLSGSMQGAGGVGGLVSMTVHNGAWAGTYFYAFDGNGNVAALVSAYDGTVVARYEYDPFGKMLRATGPLAFTNPFRFSTKFQDDETGLLYYGYRYYDPQTGRWLSRDPIQESDGGNIYAFVHNAPAGQFDVAGLWGTDSHYNIIFSWMDNKGRENGKNYYAYKWKCCSIPVATLLKQGNDDVDGSDLRSIWAAQATRNANQHAMRVPFQPISEARAGYNSFINGEKSQARAMAARARAIANTDPYGACRLIEDAVRALGRAQHPIADSTSPAHAGFQAWIGPDIVGGSLGDAAELGPEVGMPAIMAGLVLTIFYEAYLDWHMFRERSSVYERNRDTAISTVRGGVDGDLDNVLSE